MPEGSMASDTFVVVCGVAQNAQRHVLIEERVKGEYHGRWDLPGGKVQVGECHEHALAREWLEELNVAIHVGPLISIRPGLAPHGYMLWFYKCTVIQGAVPLVGVDGQRLVWIAEADVDQYDLLPQDRAVLLEDVFPHSR